MESSPEKTWQRRVSLIIQLEIVLDVCYSTAKGNPVREMISIEEDYDLGFTTDS